MDGHNLDIYEDCVASSFDLRTRRPIYNSLQGLKDNNLLGFLKTKMKVENLDEGVCFFIFDIAYMSIHTLFNSHYEIFICEVSGNVVGISDTFISLIKYVILF